MIELKNVSKYYHSGEVTNLGLHNINLRFEKNEIVAICGESGCGKSTLLNVITKNDGFDEGEIFYKGNETSYFSVSDMDDFRKNKIGFIFQDYNIIDSYTVLENVMLPLILKGERLDEAKKKALSLIDSVGLHNRIKSRGTKLSGGEKQRVAIARALASDCEILACDEPTGNLDSKTGAEIIKLIKEVAKDKLVLIVTHNYDEVKDIATRKITIADGEIRNDEIFVKEACSENVDINLDYVPLKRRIAYKIAKNNIIFTPKKTILLSLIFLAICLSALFMFQTIYMNTKEETNEYVYVNNMESRIVCFDSSHQEIDRKLLEGYDYDKNPFYEDLAEAIFLKTSYDEKWVKGVGYSDRIDYKLISGKEPEKENEVILVCFKDSFAYQILEEDNFNGTIDFGYKQLTDNAEDDLLNICGVGLIDNKLSVKNTDHVFLTHCNRAKNLIQNDLIATNINVSFTEKPNCEIKILPNPRISKATLSIPKEYKDQKLSVILFGIYDISNIFDIEYTNGDVVVLQYSYGFEIELPLFEASVYSNNVNKTISALLDTGLIAKQTRTVSKLSPLEKFVKNLTSYMIVFGSSFILVIVYFITYIILARVYQSKKKDYEILRTLGVTKLDMKHIVNFEVLSVSIFTILFSYLSFFILLILLPQASGLGMITFPISLIYFTSTLLFAYFTAHRFNRKLFKFSVTKSMKGDKKHD